MQRQLEAKSHKSILERIVQSPTALATAITAGIGGLASSAVHCVNAISLNTLSKDLTATSQAISDPVLSAQVDGYHTRAYDASRRSGNTILATFAVPTVALTVPAISRWQGLDKMFARVRDFRKNALFNLGASCQIAGLSLVIKAANEDGAHNPQIAIAWGMGGMMLLNIGNVLVLAQPNEQRQAAGYDAADNADDLEAARGSYQPPEPILAAGAGAGPNRQ